LGITGVFEGLIRRTAGGIPGRFTGRHVKAIRRGFGEDFRRDYGITEYRTDYPIRLKIRVAQIDD
jgi:hypothetical protein